MTTSNPLIKKFIEILFFIGFIIIFLYVVKVTYIDPNFFRTPIILLIGFTIIIFGLFYFLINLDKENQLVLSFNFLNENTAKIILLLLMCIFFFIPPTFNYYNGSYTIMAWTEIPLINYLKGIVMLITSAFLPGACFFNIIFKEKSLHKRFNVEPLIIKLTLYPLISFSLLGTITLFLDQLNLLKQDFSSVLFITILTLFFLDFFFQKRRKNCKILHLKQFKISKRFMILIIISIGAIICGLAINLSSLYLIPGDNWRGTVSAYLIGDLNYSPVESTASYSIYWGYVSFGLSILSGLPFININVLLFPFLYIYILSLYLFLKTLLYGLKEKYIILSLIIIILFSSWPFQGAKIMFRLNGLFQFSYRSFAFFTLFLSMAMFIINNKNNNNELKYKKLKSESILINFLSAFFLLQSFMTYFLTIIPAITVFITYFLFSEKKKETLKNIQVFWLFFTILFVIIDIISIFFFSYIVSTWVSMLFNIPFYIYAESYMVRRFLTSFLIYGILITIYLIQIFFSKFSIKFQVLYIKLQSFRSRLLSRCKLSPKFLFLGFFSTYTILLIMFLFHIRFLGAETNNFFYFYINLIFSFIGFIGIFGLYFTYLCYNIDKRLFYILTFWALFLGFIGSILIFRNWVLFPTISPLDIPELNYFNMMYWYYRYEYYIIIPTSIFASIGLINLIEVINSKSKSIFNILYLKFRIIRRNILSKFKSIFNIPYLKFRIKRRNILSKFKIKIINFLIKSKSLISQEDYKLNFIFILITITFYNSIMMGIHWEQHWRPSYFDGEEAQVIGWVSQNIPYNSNILYERFLIYHIEDIGYFNPVRMSVLNDNMIYEGWYTSIVANKRCNAIISNEVNNYSYILNIQDQNDKGIIEYKIEFDSLKKNGSFEFLLRSNNTTNYFYIFNDAFKVFIYKNSFYINEHNNRILSIQNEIWYKINIDFECSNNSYKNLNQYEFGIKINDFSYGTYKFLNNLSQMGEVKFKTNKADYNYTIYIDNLKFSWAPDIDLFEYILSKKIEYLKSNDIKYLILSKYLILRFEAIILNFYKIKLYEYENLVVFEAVY